MTSLFPVPDAAAPAGIIRVTPQPLPPDSPFGRLTLTLAALMQSSRRLEREAGGNVELMWLTGKLAPDFKTIADFRRDHGAAIQRACRRFVMLRRQLGLIAGGMVAVDGSRLRAVNARDRNFTPITIRRRMEQVDASIERYLGMLDTADRRAGGDGAGGRGHA